MKSVKGILILLLGFVLPRHILAADVAVQRCKVLVVVGMEDERAIAAGDNVDVVVGTANAQRLWERLKAIDLSEISAVYSFGVAGGLNPALKPGDLLISTQVIAQQRNESDNGFEESWTSDSTMLVTAMLHAEKTGVLLRKGVFLGTDFEARDNPETGKSDLRNMTGADTIDNESHIAAKFASDHNLPFISIRAVSDSVNNPLPPAALISLDPEDGSPDGKAIAKSILLNPLQIPALIRTGWEYYKALRALKAFRNHVGFDKLVACP